ncbi:MAG: sigma-70 family RNA polymerase sigma factor [Clostridia bacterium]|nr:sigma-70 family RNA polymerase sigma factor [Clostridia bacterium]
MEQVSDILAYVKLAQAGDQAAFEALKDKYKPLLESSARRATVEGMNSQDVEDLGQEALVNFYRAVCSYDCERHGVEFGLYAKICIDNGLVSFVRSYMRRRRKMTVPLSEGDELYEEIEDPLESLIQSEKETELVHTIKNHLSDYENRIWWLYVSGNTVSEIAQRIGAPGAKSVSNAIYRIRKKLKSIIEDPN